MVDKDIFLAYLDENNIKIEGWYLLLEQGENFVKIQTKDNILTLPYSRILKIKERLR